MACRFQSGAILGLLLAFASPASSQTDCSIIGQNTQVRTILDEFYLWYRELPDLDPALFDSPEAYLDAVRFRPLDASFSYVSSRQATEAFFSSSQFIGIGFSMRQTGPLELRVSQVFPDSPASESGLARGDFLTAIAGRSIEDLLTNGGLDEALGPSEIGYTLELSWRTPRGREETATVTKRLVTIPTVSQTAILDASGLPVGYVHLRNFVEPSIAALDQAFTELGSAGVTDIVLDLRYNGGGLIDVARHLGGLIGGFRTSTQVFVELVHNDKNTFRNRTIRFEDPEATLDLPRVVVITTRASASSSELLINGLRPFVPVTVVGERTFGKPVGQYGFDLCDKVLFPVSFENKNARGEGGFFDGIPADCEAADQLGRPLGHPDEDSLAEALHVLTTGRCSPSPGVRALRTDFSPLARDGYRQMLNAW
ncbi:MAG TPA: S41 family peptidase [Vicinamibacteria bacterium]|nr:S41 family peptidase [Vicinamibacteria bacterium]